jgi:hypothetical protein
LAVSSYFTDEVNNPILGKNPVDRMGGAANRPDKSTSNLQSFVGCSGLQYLSTNRNPKRIARHYTNEALER